MTTSSVPPHLQHQAAPGERHRIEKAIELLIAVLDQMDGEADNEPYLSAGAETGFPIKSIDDLEAEPGL